MSEMYEEKTINHFSVALLQTHNKPYYSTPTGCVPEVEKYTHFVLQHKYRY